MHDAIFADAARPVRVVLLKLELSEYSIGHEILLFSQRNPLVTLPETAFNELPSLDRIAAIQRAVLICTRDWEQSPQTDVWFKEWEKKNEDTDWEKSFDTFRDYRAAGSLTLPTVKMPRVQGVPHHYFGSPEAAQLLNFCLIDLKLPHADACNFPFGLARILLLTKAETDGQMWVQNEQDLKFELEKKAHEAAHPENTLVIGDEAVAARIAELQKLHPDIKFPTPEPRPAGAGPEKEKL